MQENDRAETIFRRARNQKAALSAWRFVCVFVFSIFACAALFAQIPLPKTSAGKSSVNRNRTPAESSIAVDARVNVRLCVNEGALKINGWERNEIRAFVAGGNGAVGFKILQKNKQNDSPVWVAVVGDSSKAKQDECLSGDSIELDVPRGATVSVKSRESETTIDSIGKATIENLGGNIYLSNITHGIDATTYEGDITVEKSGGAIVLQTTTGNIVAFALAPGEIGDQFKAKTNSGAIVLRGIEHRQIEANSNSGALRFAGEFLAGGQYTFNAFNGSINLQIPANSACRINASYGFGAFNSEIALTNIVKSLTRSKAQNLSAQIGAGGDATLNLSTYSGTIQIKKL